MALGNAGLRKGTSQICPGSFYNLYSGVVACTAGLTINAIIRITDAGWFGPNAGTASGQTLLFQEIQWNRVTRFPKWQRRRSLLRTPSPPFLRLEPRAAPGADALAESNMDGFAVPSPCPANDRQPIFEFVRRPNPASWEKVICPAGGVVNRGPVA
jgi:hypothetical protein